MKLYPFSIIDQVLMQLIEFENGCFIDNYDGTILISSLNAINCLLPVSWEKQIKMLLKEKRVKDALDLGKNFNEAGLSREAFTRQYNKFQQEAGFVELSQNKLDEAKEMFVASKLDVRELLRLIPSISVLCDTYQTNFTEFSDIVAIKENNILNFIMEYLIHVNQFDQDQYHQQQQLIDTALIVLFIELSLKDKVLQLVCDKSKIFNKNFVKKYLLETGNHHLLAYFYCNQEPDQIGDAIEIWKKLYNRELEDENYLGLQSLVDVLIENESPELVLSNIDFVLKEDELLGVSVFIRKGFDDNLFKFLPLPSVIERLKRYPKAFRSYLEYLIFVVKIEVIENYLIFLKFLMKDKSNLKKFYYFIIYLSII